MLHPIVQLGELNIYLSDRYDFGTTLVQYELEKQIY